MSDIMNPAVPGGPLQLKPGNFGKPAQDDGSDIGLRFEKMLWAEMLSHSGLEKAFTQSGGKAASAFSQYMVEAIAEDIAERHPLGFDPAGEATAKLPQGFTGKEG